RRDRTFGGGLLGGGRRGFAKVERPHTAALRVEVSKESAAAESRRFRLENGECEGDRHRRIDGVAAVFQQAQPDLRRRRRRGGKRGVGGGDLGTGEGVGDDEEGEDGEANADDWNRRSQSP